MIYILSTHVIHSIIPYFNIIIIFFSSFFFLAVVWERGKDPETSHLGIGAACFGGWGRWRSFCPTHPIPSHPSLAYTTLHYWTSREAKWSNSIITPPNSPGDVGSEELIKQLLVAHDEECKKRLLTLSLVVAVK